MTEQNPEDILRTIETLAPVVAQQHADLTAAFSDETKAEAAVLARAIELAKPALKALCSRLVATESCVIDKGNTERTYHDERGLCLTDKKPSPTQKKRDRDASRGQYGGSDLVLLADGRLAEMEYSGTWTRWQGEFAEWVSTLTPASVIEAASDYTLTELLERIAEALNQQAAGKAPERAKAARERAAKLTALVALSK